MEERYLPLDEDLILMIQCKNNKHRESLRTKFHELLTGCVAYVSDKIIVTTDEEMIRNNPTKSRQQLNLPYGPCVIMYQFYDLTEKEYNELPKIIQTILGNRKLIYD